MISSRCRSSPLQAEAVEIIAGQIETIVDRWDDIADEARIVSAERIKMRGAQILNPFALQNWKS
jgi:hypothetical protein